MASNQKSQGKRQRLTLSISLVGAALANGKPRNAVIADLILQH